MKDRSELLREMIDHYMMKYGINDPEARRAIKRDLTQFIDIDDAVERQRLRDKKSFERWMNTNN